MSPQIAPESRVVMKVGGAILDDPERRAAFAASVARAIEGFDLSVVVIHGGGAQLSRQCERLGIEVERDSRGLRVTNSATLTAAIQVLAGEVNTALVSALAHAGVPGIGMTGADANLMGARRIDDALGAVGEVDRVNAAALDGLCAARFVPVVTTLAPDVGEGSAGSSATGFLNVNADAAVAPIAAAFGADAVLFLSDVAGVLDGEGEMVSWLDAESAAQLEAKGVLGGGMIPKVEAALGAAAALPGSLVKIASGEANDCVVAALYSDSGTSFALGEGAVHGG